MREPFKLGQIVVVCQDVGHISIENSQLIRHTKHDCSKPEQHWYSRITGWNEYQDLPIIAIKLGDNPCCYDWTWTPQPLTIIEDEYDWTGDSAYRVGHEVRVALPIDIHYLVAGSFREAKIVCPHIEPEDWVVEFNISKHWWDKERALRDTSEGNPFSMVINEKHFIVDGPSLPPKRTKPRSRKLRRK